MILKLCPEVFGDERGFESPVDFNDSQTSLMLIMTTIRFESPVDFNNSQTE